MCLCVHSFPQHCKPHLHIQGYPIIQLFSPSTIGSPASFITLISLVSPVEPASEPGETKLFARSLQGLTKDAGPPDEAEELEDEDEDEGVRGACSWALAWSWA